MEELIGSLWHRLITRAACSDHPHAAVNLEDVAPIAGVLLRAFGGEPALRVAPSGDTRHAARRRWLQRLAGSGTRVAQTELDMETLRLPKTIARFPDRASNFDLYIWLIALGGMHCRQRHRLRLLDSQDAGTRWLTENQAATREVLQRFPGLAARYARLVKAHVAERIPPGQLPPDEAAAENAVRLALRDPGSVAALPPAPRPPQAVPMWLSVRADEALTRESVTGTTPDEPTHRATSVAPTTVEQRRRGQHVEAKDGRDGLLMPFRAESLLSWSEYVRVHRPTDENVDTNAARAAEDMDTVSIARGEAGMARVRFDLDLPAPTQDDLPLGPGLLLPEWDWKTCALRPDYVRIQPMRTRDAANRELPEHLRRAARRLRGQFSVLTPQRRWLRGQSEGTEIDMDALVRFKAEQASGALQPEPDVYCTSVRAARDLACLVMADLSLSTDAWVSNSHRVIDAVREGLLLLGEALDATGDSFAFYGFSSLERAQVRIHSIKEFDEPYDRAACGRVQALKPGYYTRMGAALRFATRILGERENALRLLLLLTDGKPNDIDHYEGRYAIEDTAAAVREARRAGLRPFCVTIDREAADYLPHLFGRHGYILVRRAEELPRRLPRLYAQLIH